MKNELAIPQMVISSKIFLIRNQKIMLDMDLAELYQVETKQLKRQVKRNIERFPDDFMFELTKEEFENLRRHFGTSNWGGTRYMPMAFTEQGIAMLSSVLRSKKAIEVNIAIMRTFVQLRKESAVNKSLSRRLSKLEQKYDEQFTVVFDALRNLIEPPSIDKQPIGFVHPKKGKRTS